MKVEFLDWGLSGSAEPFILEMPVAPRIGEEISFDIDMVPKSYFEGQYKDNHSETLGGRIVVMVLEIEHRVSADGYLLRAGIEFES